MRPWQRLHGLRMLCWESNSWRSSVSWISCTARRVKVQKAACRRERSYEPFGLGAPCSPCSCMLCCPAWQYRRYPFLAVHVIISCNDGLRLLLLLLRWLGRVCHCATS
jgi:hypothetical protein